MFHFIITGQSGQGAVILYIYFMQLSPKSHFIYCSSIYLYHVQKHTADIAPFS